jgi:predicted GIY-YIG superfamily endonuclease
MGCVYLIHFAEPLRHARHYLGYADNLEARLHHHKSGSGANLMRVVTRAGIEWEVVRTWEGATRGDERRMKNGRHVPRFCPVCKAEKKGGRID